MVVAVTGYSAWSEISPTARDPTDTLTYPPDVRKFGPRFNASSISAIVNRRMYDKLLTIPLAAATAENAATCTWLGRSTIKMTSSPPIMK
jgi:hypothetical protein